MSVPGTVEIADSRPNILVVGVGHSGTTVLTKLLDKLGWDAYGADASYAEHKKIRNFNRYALQHDCLGDQEEIADVLLDLNAHKPWVVKDPRFTVTLRHWWEHFRILGDDAPVVVRITKNMAKVRASYLRRGEIVRGKPGNKWAGAARGLTVEEQINYLDNQLRNWKGPIITLAYEQIAEAVSIFQPR